MSFSDSLYRGTIGVQYKVLRADYQDGEVLDQDGTSLILNKAAAEGFRLHSVGTDSNADGLPMIIFVMIKDG